MGRSEQVKGGGTARPDSVEVLIAQVTALKVLIVLIYVIFPFPRMGKPA
jgi:hypothetical protein